MSSETFDYIVVGAGSAGAALAARLAEAPDVSVLLLEAGSDRYRDFWVRVPIGVAKVMVDRKYVWMFNTVAQVALDAQQVFWPRGRLLGGSSSVNGMIFVRGDPAEFDNWRAVGNVGWGYEDLVPYFKKLEATTIGDDGARGRSGPIAVSSLASNANTLGDAFLAACKETGYTLNPDYNDGSYEGASYLQLSTRSGLRCSTAEGYLRPARKSRNLTVRTDSLALRVLFEGKRATGIEYNRDKQQHSVFAAREVILSAGPIKSPQLLEVSGIGDGARLGGLGIPVVHHLPGVGENLVDHLQSRLTYASKGVTTLNEVLANPLRQFLMGAGYLVSRRGLMATSTCSAHAIVKSSAAAGRPDVKLQVFHHSGGDRYSNDAKSGLDSFPGFSLGFFQLRPESRGSVHAASRDARDDPVIDPRYLSSELDRNVAVAALVATRRLAAKPGLARHIDHETRPSAQIHSDAELLDFVKKSGQTSFHPVGTCKMGVDSLAVVDPQLRVRGIAALRVVDSSIMPTLPTSNTNAASIMIGEKAAEMIRTGA